MLNGDGIENGKKKKKKKQKQNKEEKKGTSAIGLISQKNNILHFADNCAQNWKKLTNFSYDI